MGTERKEAKDRERIEAVLSILKKRAPLSHREAEVSRLEHPAILSGNSDAATGVGGVGGASDPPCESRLGVRACRRFGGRSEAERAIDGQPCRGDPGFGFAPCARVTIATGIYLATPGSTRQVGFHRFPPPSRWRLFRTFPKSDHSKSCPGYPPRLLQRRRADPPKASSRHHEAIPPVPSSPASRFRGQAGLENWDVRFELRGGVLTQRTYLGSDPVHRRVGGGAKGVRKSKEERGSVQESPFADMREYPVPLNFRLPSIDLYDGVGDRRSRHAAAFRLKWPYMELLDALMCGRSTTR
ncbi:hypothetical protein MUK42_05641 [Musa troglodytarum]|uniref:Uncharacterized protein n=1 Tax=Musa troglodytarum TaxID=320322 RepID=A0A9E7JWE3_9LILI|nr:hypothetical protein MUK42_05641 [Musa troglodytarum]